MPKAKRIFVIADFKDESPWSVCLQARRWVKGLILLGHDVQRFSYRNILKQYNPFSGKHFRRFMPRFARNTADGVLAKQVKLYHPDVVLLLSMKYYTPDTVRAAREAAPDAVFIGRDEDPYPEKNPDRLAVARETDMVINTSCGRFLKAYKDAGVRRCAFMPNMCDPSIQYRYEVDDKWKTDITFLGVAAHSRLPREDDRYAIAKRLSEMPNARVYACFGRPEAVGIDCFHAISGAKIAVSINIANDVRLYHSDRLINYVACGTFTLARRVPDTDLLFEDGVHLKYFDSTEECFELADWYLKHDEQREKIARAGMQKAHADYNCRKIAQYMLDLVETGSYNAPWAEVL